MRLFSSLVTVVTIVCAAAPESASALTPPIPPLSGPYRVQPGGVVLACGGIVGNCRTFELEGTIELLDSFTKVRITKTDLRLRDDNGAAAFPAANDLVLVGLEGPIVIEGDTKSVELAADGPNGQRVALELVGVGVVANLVGNVRLALRGTYDEGCCDRYVYEFGNVRLEPDIFDGLALGLQDWPRFFVNVFRGTGAAQVAAAHERLGSSHGYFWFYTPENPEVFVKMVSACGTPFRSIWFFASGLTNQGVRIEVFDSWSYQTRTYFNPPGVPFAPIQDTVGFPCLTP